MNQYIKIGFLDHVEDIVSGEVIQEGTPLSQRVLGRMDDGIFAVTVTTIEQEAQIASLQAEIKVLKDATLNNMINNVFLKNFDSVTSVAIASGIFDPVARKIYV